MYLPSPAKPIEDWHVYLWNIWFGGLMPSITVGCCDIQGLPNTIQGTLDRYQIDGLVQDCSNSSALAMELLQSYTKPSK